MATKQTLSEIRDELHNVKTLTYINFVILVVLLAFVIGVVAKQLGL
ncbi:hypothetical protein HY571_01740 [Candidatus Micrarchaeota archaeon]|nr:hypothetical protein [Candidatus Micrarchaeota archaeon]